MPGHLREPNGHFASLMDVDVSRTGRWVASLDHEGVAILWRAGNPPVPTLMGGLSASAIARTGLPESGVDGPLWRQPTAKRVAVVGNGAALVIYTDDNQAVVWRRGGGRPLRLAGAALVLAVGRDELRYVRVRGRGCELVKHRRGRLTVLAKLSAPPPGCLWLSFAGRREFYAISETDVYRWTLPGLCASRLPAPPGVALCPDASQAYRDGPQLRLPFRCVNVHTGRWAVTGEAFFGGQAQRLASGVRVSSVSRPPGVLVEGDARWPAAPFGVLENRVIGIRSTKSGPVALLSDGSILGTPVAAPSPPPPPGTRTLHADDDGVWSASQDGVVTRSSGGTQTSWSVGDPHRESVQLRVAGQVVVAWWFGRTRRIARLWPGGRALIFEDLPERILAVAFAADDRVAISCDGRVQVRDSLGRVELDWREDSGWITSPCFTSDGRGIWLHRRQQYACYPLVSTSDGRLPKPIGPPLRMPGQVAAAASCERRVVLAVVGLPVLVWIDLEDSSFWTEAIVGPVCLLTFSAAGTRLYVGTEDGRVLSRKNS